MSDAPIVTVENGKGVYRASAVGMCERALIAARMGMTAADAPAWLQERFQQGHELESRILDDVAQYAGDFVTNHQFELNLPIGEFAVIRGHIDGTVVVGGAYPDDDDRFMVEAKAFAKSYMEKWRCGVEEFFAACPYYRDQLTIYMEGTHLPALYAVHDKTTGKTDIKVITSPPGNINTIIAKVLKVEMAGRNGKLPKECHAPTWPCPFFYLPGHGSPAATPDSSDEFETLAQECCEAREDKQRAEARAKEANKRLLEYLTAKGEKKVQGVGYVANRVSGKNSHPDREAMKADGVWEKYKKVTEYEYAVAKRVEDG